MRLKIRTIFILSALVVIVPLTGFPNSWKYTLETLFGIALCVVTYFVHRELKNHSMHIYGEREVVTDSYVESGAKTPAHQAHQQEVHSGDK